MRQNRKPEIYLKLPVVVLLLLLERKEHQILSRSINRVPVLEQTAAVGGFNPRTIPIIFFSFICLSLSLFIFTTPIRSLALSIWTTTTTWSCSKWVAVFLSKQTNKESGGESDAKYSSHEEQETRCRIASQREFPDDILSVICVAFLIWLGFVIHFLFVSY